MSETILRKLEKIEKLLLDLNSKIENFLGFEELSKKEKEEIKRIETEIKEGKYETFDEVFSD